MTRSSTPSRSATTPPKSVAAAAARGLRLRERHGRGGTAVGVARARDLSAQSRCLHRPLDACIRTSRDTAWTRAARAGRMPRRHRPATSPGCSGAAMQASAGQRVCTRACRRQGRKRGPAAEMARKRPQQRRPQPSRPQPSRPRQEKPRRRSQQKRRLRKRPHRRSAPRKKQRSRALLPERLQRPRSHARQARKLQHGVARLRRTARPRKRHQGALRPRRAPPQLPKSVQPRRPRPGTRPARRALRIPSHCLHRRRPRPASAQKPQAGHIRTWWTTWPSPASAARASVRPSPAARKSVQERNSGIGKARCTVHAALSGVRNMPVSCRHAAGPEAVPTKLWSGGVCCRPGIGPSSTSPRPTHAPTSCATETAARIARRLSPVDPVFCALP